MTLKERLTKAFSLDLRSLALFRILIATCILGDLITRSVDLIPHYTDLGILPRAALLHLGIGDARFCLHLANGTAFYEGLLFLIQGFFALMLFFGFRTRLATLGTWILLTSLQHRNHMILSGGDVLLRVCLFWCLFLPLGARYSFDSALNSKEEPEKSPFVFSAGTVAYMFQIALLYWFAVLIKMQPNSRKIWWDQGLAVYQALCLDQFTLPLGYFLLNFTGFLKILNYATLFIETFGPLLYFPLFFFNTARIAGVLLFTGLHLSFGICLFVGLFTWIGALSVSPFLPDGFWDFFSRLLRKRMEGIQIYFDEECLFCKKMARLIQTFCFFSKDSIKPAQAHAEILTQMNTLHSWIVTEADGTSHHGFDALLVLLKKSFVWTPLGIFLGITPLRSLGEKIYQHISTHRGRYARLLKPLAFRPLKVRLSIVENLLAFFFILYIFMWNLSSTYSTFTVPFNNKTIGQLLSIDQYWNMFSPPLTEDGWYVIPGKLMDGTRVDLFRDGAPVSWKAPKEIVNTYKNHRWAKYMMNLWASTNAPYRLYYGKYLCRTWNSTHTGKKKLDTFKIYYMRDDTVAPGQPKSKPQKVEIWHHYCFASPKADEM